MKDFVRGCLRQTERYMKFTTDMFIDGFQKFAAFSEDAFPEARSIGTSVVEGYRLLFKGSRTGSLRGRRSLTAFTKKGKPAKTALEGSASHRNTHD